MAYRYFVLYKPYGMLSQFSREAPQHNTLADLNHTFPSDVYPVGRLDKDSEGLLLLTNDKRLNQALLHPKQQHGRNYWVQVDNIPTPKALQQLEQGVTIRLNKRDYRTRPAQVQLLTGAPPVPPRNPPIRFRAQIPTAWLDLRLIEGKNRQVRRMTAAVGFPTLRLVRHRIGDVTLGNLMPGMVQEWKGVELLKQLQLQQLG